MLVLNYSVVSVNLIPSFMWFTDGEMETAKAMAAGMLGNPAKYREVSLYQYNVSRSGSNRKVAVDAFHSPEMKGVKLWNGAEVVELQATPLPKKVKANRTRKAPVVAAEDISASLIEKTPARSRRKSVAKALSNA